VHDRRARYSPGLRHRQQRFCRDRRRPGQLSALVLAMGVAPRPSDTGSGVVIIVSNTVRAMYVVLVRGRIQRA
jgi:hypothetical protein